VLVSSDTTHEPLSAVTAGGDSSLVQSRLTRLCDDGAEKRSCCCLTSKGGRTCLQMSTVRVSADQGTAARNGSSRLRRLSATGVDRQCCSEHRLLSAATGP
jgi:hypothetical protein